MTVYYLTNSYLTYIPEWLWNIITMSGQLFMLMVLLLDPTIEYKDLSRTEITLTDDFNILKDIFRSWYMNKWIVFSTIFKNIYKFRILWKYPATLSSIWPEEIWALFVRNGPCLIIVFVRRYYRPDFWQFRPKCKLTPHQSCDCVVDVQTMNNVTTVCSVSNLSGVYSLVSTQLIVGGFENINL